MKILYSTLLMGLLFLAQVKAQPTQLATFSPAQMHHDLQSLKESLLQYHPGLFFYQDSAEFFAAIDSTAALLDTPKDVREFYQLINPLIARVKCGHTAMYLPDEALEKIYLKEAFFPFKLKFIQGKAYVHYSFNPPVMLPKGTEICAINGLPMQEIVAAIMPQLYSDGDNVSGKWHELNNWFWLYYQLTVDQSSTFKLTYKLPNTERLESTIFEGAERSQIAIVKQAQPPLQFTVYPKTAQASVAKLDINTFNNQVISQHKQKFDRFLDNSFTALAEQQVETLIIDLRGNQGGNDVNGALLLSYLSEKPFSYYKSLTVNKKTKSRLPIFQKLFFRVKKDEQGRFQVLSHRNLGKLRPAKNYFSGKIIVLLDGGSFSATSQFSAVLHSMDRAEFVGEPMSGGYIGNSSGFFLSETLPHSGLEISIPAIKYENAVSGNAKAQPLLDYPVTLTLNNWLQQQDTALQKAFQLIRERNTLSAREQ